MAVRGTNSVHVVDAHTGADLTALTLLVREYINTWYRPGAPWSAEDRQLIATLPGPHVPPAGAALLALVGGLAAGCLLLAPHGDKEMELSKLYVRPEWRRAGVAQTLIGEAKSRAAAAGRTLVLQVHEDRLPAIALYLTLGFTPRERRVTGFLNMALRPN